MKENIELEEAYGIIAKPIISTTVFESVKINKSKNKNFTRQEACNFIESGYLTYKECQKYRIKKSNTKNKKKFICTLYRKVF